jgi:hypothetical protein
MNVPHAIVLAAIIVGATVLISTRYTLAVCVPSIAESGEWECLDERDFGATRLGNFCRCKGRQPMIPSSSS